MNARDEILRRVRSALGDDRPPVAAVPRAYRQRERAADLVDLLVERVRDYRARVEVCPADEVVARVSAALPADARVRVPPGLTWPVPGVTDDGLTAMEADGFDAVVSGATVAVAETGTIVLTHGPGEGRRMLSLIPDRHVCIVRAEQIVPDVPAAVRTLDPNRPQTWISGPSATSDIELDRVEGVHGPRRLHVIVVT